MKKNDTNQILESLKKKGFAIIDNYFTQDFCNKVILEIENKIRDKDFTNNQSQTSGGDTRLYKFENVSYDAKKFSEDQFLLSIADEYIEKKLSTHFVLAGKLEYSEDTKASSGGGWHRDSDGKQFKAMLYLNDVNSNNGPFLFVPNSKKIDAKRQPIKKLNSLLFYIKRFLKYLKIRDPRYSEKSISNFFRKRKLVPIEFVAKKGTVILFDSSYIHRGKIIEKGLRYTLTNYYFEDSIKSQESTLKGFGHLFVS